MADRSRDWLAQAERDLESARWLLQGGYCEWACFLSQQAAEKAIKALYKHLHGEAWGHSVRGLIAALPQGIAPDQEIHDAALRLDKLYIPPRYPNGFASGSPKDYFIKKDAEDAIEDAARIIGFCKSHIP